MELEKRDICFTLKTAREAGGYSQIEASHLLGVSTDTLSNYEGGKSYPNVPVIRKIENIYKANYNQLIFLPFDYDKTVQIV